MIRAIYRLPFSLDVPVVRAFGPGHSVAQIMAQMHPEADLAMIGGHVIPRERWERVYPKPTAVIEVSHLVHGGGEGGGGGKNILSLVASLGLIALTGGIASGAILGGASANLGAALGIGKALTANILAGGVGLIGSLLLSGLTPPPTLGPAGDAQKDRSASASGNPLEANAAMWRVVGERRVAPPLLAQPLVTLDGQDEVVEVVCGLAGPHRLQDIRIGSAEAATMPGVQLETREGWPGDRPLRLLRRYGATQQVNAEIPAHKVEGDAQNILERTIDVSQAVPQRLVYATGQAPDEHQIQVAFPQGVGRPSDEGDQVRIPLRLRLREVGSDTWTVLPELHYRAAALRLLRATIRLIWADEGSVALSMSGRTGWVEARISAPGQTVAPATEAFAVDAYFDGGSGDGYLTGNNLASSAVRHVYGTADELSIYLDPATFAPGQYEVEIQRGAAVREAVWDSADYEVSGQVRDLFGYSGTVPEIAFSREGLSDTVAVLRSVSIWNDRPVQTDEVALVAVRARNVQLEEISVLAGGYVPTWGGSAWTGWSVSSNPADHLRDIYVGRSNADPLPESMLDDANMLVPFRAHCASEGYTCNAIIRGDSPVAEAARIVAGCGYGRPYMSEVWGVIWDRDRSADSPVQMFTPRNSRGLTITKDFARLPDGLRVTFDDASRDWQPRQITVWRKGAARDTSRTEQVRYEGVDTEAAARARAAYDLEVLTRRSCTYALETPPESIVSRRGDLVAVSHDILSEQHGFGRVIAGGADQIVLDAAMPLINEPNVDDVTNFDAVQNVDLLGLVSAAAIQRADGTVDVEPLDCVTGETDVLTFASPTTHVDEGQLVAVGPLATETLRLIVAGVTPDDQMGAALTLIDEASELFA